MRHGDFTELAKYYVDRPGYSSTLLSYIKSHAASCCGRETRVADVGAGTGKLTEELAAIGLSGYAVEPNDAMREQGIKSMRGCDAFEWRDGAAEETGLPDGCVDWVLMGSSFHWTDAPRAIAEFKRILRPGGHFTAIWNPRDITRSELHTKIEAMITDELPEMTRVSSGSTVTTDGMLRKVCGGGGDISSELVYMEARHDERMTRERYMNIWRSVNDIRVQAGEERFKRILSNIETMLGGLEVIDVPYLSRAWTTRLK